MNIIVIGGGAAGASAAVRAKKLNPQYNVILIEATDMVTHGPCAIPYYVEGIVRDYSQLITYTPSYLKEKRGVNVLVNTKALDLDIDKKLVIVEKYNKSIEKIKWSKLVIATGALPILLPGADKNNVIAIRHPVYVNKIKEVIERARVIAIVGGGYLGIEMAEAITALGKKVILFEKNKSILPDAIDFDIAKTIGEEIIMSGIELHLSEPVIEISGKEDAEKIITEKGEYMVDAVVLAIGVKPNTELVKNIGINLGVKGAIAVNEYMETSIEDIYAAGDVAEKYHRILKKKVWIPLATTANKEGLIAGTNAVRGRELRFRGITGTSVTKFHNLYIAKTGLIEKEAIEHGINYKSRIIKTKTKAHYYPSATEVIIKIITDNSDRIIGVQAIGKDVAVAHYIDIAAIAIENNMTIEDLFFSDLGYMPATAPVWHPLIVASRVSSEGRL